MADDILPFFLKIFDFITKLKQRQVSRGDGFLEFQWGNLLDFQIQLIQVLKFKVIFWKFDM